MGSKHYSEGFKARMVQRMTAPGGPFAVELAKDVNIPHQTLSRWLRDARSVALMSKRKPPPPGAPSTPPSDRDARSTREWTPMEKVRVIAAAAQLKDEELGAFLRREGLHLDEVERWREELMTALGAPPPRTRNPEAKRVRELEREVARKDKALAEVTALLVLEKKLQALFGSGSAEEGDSTDEETEKK